MERINRWRGVTIVICRHSRHTRTVTIDIIHKNVIPMCGFLYTAEKVIVLHVKKHGYMGGSLFLVFKFKGGPEPLEKKIKKILGSKREDRFSDPFFRSDTKYLLGSFFVPAAPQHFL